MSTLTEEQISALPQSSSEDEGDGDTVVPEASANVDESKCAGTGRKRKFQSVEVSSSIKNPKSSRTSSRIPKAESKSQPSIPDSIPASFSVPASDPLDWLNSSQNSRSQSSQGKRRANYSKTNIITTSSNGTSKKAQLADIPDDISLETTEQPTPRRTRASRFTTIADLPPEPSKRRLRTHSKIKDVLPDLELEKPKITFSMPEDDSILEPNSSMNTLLTDPSNGFEIGVAPGTRGRRSNSIASSSSLSDIDSVLSLEIELENDRLKAESVVNGVSATTELSVTHVRCPICARPVNKAFVATYLLASNTKTVTTSNGSRNKTMEMGITITDPSRFSQQQQQDFCYQHQVHNARQEWSERGYPKEINWITLEKERLPKHMPHLRSILTRKRPSHYLALLEHKIKTSTGHKQKSLKHYLTEEILDIVKPGYYGPRGAKLMAHAITEHMAKPLKMALRADQVIMDVGVSGFVSAVLLPELAMRVVMEDMDSAGDSGSSKDSVDAGSKQEKEKELEERARRVLDESNSVGALLCPDDDHVERDDADDGDVC